MKVSANANGCIILDNVTAIRLGNTGSVYWLDYYFSDGFKIRETYADKDSRDQCYEDTLEILRIE